MARLQRPSGLRAGIAVGTAIALVGFLFGVAVASIPSSSGVISACYSTKTGALRIIDAPSKHCVSGERALSWTKSAPAPAVPSVGDLACSPTPATSGTLFTEVDPYSGVVTLKCLMVLRVSSSLVLSQVSMQSNLSAEAHHDCSNTKTCTFALPPGTTDAEVLMYASVPFHFTCPGTAVQGSFFDQAHSINVGRCQNVKINSSKTVIVSA
jgi:hypothetical protein